MRDGRHRDYRYNCTTLIRACEYIVLLDTCLAGRFTLHKHLRYPFGSTQLIMRRRLAWPRTRSTSVIVMMHTITKLSF